MTLERKLYFGIPKGNLNRPESNRGDTKRLLQEAGWALTGYEHKHEEPFPTIIDGDKEVKFIVAKPTIFPYLLSIGRLDLAIYGQDIQEDFCSSVFQRFAYLMNNRNWVEERRCKIENTIYEEEWLKIRKETLKKLGKWSDDLPQNISDSQKIWNGLYTLIEKSKTNKSEVFPNELYDLNYGKVGVYFMVEKALKKVFDYPDEYLSTGSIEDIRRLLEAFLRTSSLNCITAYPNLAYREFCRLFPTEMINVTSANALGLFRKYSSSRFKNIVKDLCDSIHDKELKGKIKKKIIRRLKKAHFSKINIAQLPTTEMSIECALGDIVLDCVASGKSIKDYELEIIGPSVIKSSTARLYTTPTVIEQPTYLRSASPRWLGHSQTEIEELRTWRQKKIHEVLEKLQDAAKKLGWIK